MSQTSYGRIVVVDVRFSMETDVWGHWVVCTIIPPKPCMVL